MKKTKILPNSPVLGDIAGHLRPIIDFLIKQKNVPVSNDFKWNEKK